MIRRDAVQAFISSGTRLYYEEHGNGIPVVLLHGFTTSLAGNWQRRGWFDVLAESGFRAIALDFPSHGRSERVYDDAPCSTDALAADVVALLDHLLIPRAALVGFSMGGGVALRVALDYPSRVAKVVVGGVGDSALNRLHDPDEIRTLVAAFEADSVGQIENHNARRLRHNAELAGHEPSALLPYLRQGGWPGGLSDVDPVQVSVLLVLAADDQYMRQTKALREWLDQARLVEVGGRHHHDVLEDEAVKQSVVAFLREGEHPEPCR